MKNILVISGHPELTHSVANATILDEVETALPDVEIRRLDRLYPDGKFNIAAEQKSLLRADVIVWQFPFSWYGLPGLMKKWLDEVFVHGFAHGSTAKLGGKKLILSFTTGAPEELYTVDSFFGHTIEEYLIPFETTARLCNLELLARFIPAVSAMPTGMPTKSRSKNACPGTRFKACRTAQFRRE